MPGTNITIRIRANGNIEIEGKTICQLANERIVRKALSDFAAGLRFGDQNRRNMHRTVKTAGQRLQNACFPIHADFAELSAVLETSGPLVRVLSDEGSSMQIPWELFSLVSANCSSEVGPWWGETHVFQRTYSSPNRGRFNRRSGLSVMGRKTGFMAYDGMPGIDEMAAYLSTLSGVSFKGQFLIGDNTRDRSIREIMKYLRDLDIAHLSCIILKLQYSTEPYLVFSNTFFLSMTDLKKGLRFSKCPVVLLDACDNHWHLMPDRLEFLKRLISLGSEGIITNLHPIPRRLANDFSRCFYDELIHGSVPVYEALHKAQNRLVQDQNDPLALLFWLYGNPQDPIPLDTTTNNPSFPDSAIGLSLLVKALAYIYPDLESAKRIALSGGLKLEIIPMRQKPIDYWHEIMLEAIKQRRSEEVLATPLTEYSNNIQLYEAYWSFRGRHQQ